MFIFHPQEGAKYLRDYEKVAATLNRFKEKNDWENAIKLIRSRCWDDLFFLCFFVLGWADVNHPWLVDRINEVNESRHKTLDIWARYHWKAVDVKEPVPSLNGFKEHGSLVVGDVIFGGDGKPCRVIATHPVVHDADCFRVTFDKGYSVVVSSEHRWKVNISSRNRLKIGGRRKTREVTINTIELAEEVRKSNSVKSRINPYVCVCSPVEYEASDLEVHPYVLGVWLGDGTSSCSNITNAVADNAIVDNIRALGYNVKRQKYGGGFIATIYGLISSLKKIGVAGNKHIPVQYLEGSIDQRVDLLRGLMDTDGCCDTRGTATFCNTNKKLSEDVFVLAASLGLKPSLRQHKCEFNGRVIPVFNVSFQNRVGGINPFSLERKSERQIDSWCARSTKHRIISVEPVVSRPVSCITVDSQDGCYLIGNQFICTHNSSIITVAGGIQDVLRDPMHRLCIFSHTKTIAKDFLRRIKTTFENNGLLNAAFPDVIQENAINTKGFMWSLDDGLQLLCGSGLGGYVMASGLIDSMPTGKHFTRRIYDDVVTRESVSTSDQRAKVSECVKLSHALGDPKSGTHCFIGTRYHFGDYYGALIQSKEYVVRQHSCTHNGEYPSKPADAVDDVSALGDGRAVLYPQDHIWNEFKLMGNSTFAAQMLMNPIKADEKAFDVAWIKYYNTRKHTRNFVFVDPAGSKKEGSAYTVMWAVGVDQRNFYYILDCVRDHLDLQQRQQALFKLVEKWKAIKVFYERYSMQADIEYIEEKKRDEGFYFQLQEVGGTKLTKDERILKLQPLFQEGRIIFPEAIIYVDSTGKRRNLVDDFIMQEYNEFPVSQYKDMLDALARIRDENVKITGPAYVEPETAETDNPLLRWHKHAKEAGSNGWLNA